MKITFKKLFFLFFVIILIFSSCFSPWRGDEAVIIINLGGGGNGRAAAWPPVESGVLGQLDYKVTLSSGADSRLLTASGAETITASVTPGLWNVEIEAYYDEIPFATGSNSVDVIAGQDNHVTVEMDKTDVTFFVAAGADDWDEAVALINDGRDESFVIIVNGSFTTTKRLSLSIPCNVIIRGNNNAITLFSGDTIDPHVDSLIYITNYIDDEQAVVTMRDLKLVGHSLNNTALVSVVGGTFIMEGSASVSGNTNGEWGLGGGVYISGGGTFIMKDNASVSDNSIANFGGGVYVESGAFIMEGGSIIKNEAINGGGVYVGGGTFTMKGGTVADNTAGSNGGGVFVSGSAFTMKNYASVTGNTADINGGGVYFTSEAVDIKFTMEDNASVTGNTAASSGGGIYLNGGILNMQGNASIAGGNKAVSGGGVYLGVNTFNMYENSSVSGNIASSYGGGVYVSYSGTFRIVAGTVYGSENSIAVSLQNTITEMAPNRGAALYKDAAGTAEHGTYTGTNNSWVGTSFSTSTSSDPYTQETTIKVTNGALQQ